MTGPPAPLLHVLEAREWEAFAASGAAELRPPSLAREGFVHLSFPHQLEETIERWFPRAERLVVLELDREAAAPSLVLEPSRGGALFPHLRRPLACTDVLAAHAVERTATGLRLPEPLAALLRPRP